LLGVAAILAKPETFRPIATIKRPFPGAEVLGVIGRQAPFTLYLMLAALQATRSTSAYFTFSSRIELYEPDPRLPEGGRTSSSLK
jgi:hypothetical protein